jgi:hypothetical protein
MNWRSPSDDDYRLREYRRPHPSKSFPLGRCLVGLLVASLLTNGYLVYRNSIIATPKSFKEQLVGTWALAICEVVAPDGTKSPLVAGSNPAGQYIFTNDGHFSFQAAAEFPRFASNDRTQTTPEEDKAAVLGSIAYYGTYTVNETDNTIALHLERSSFPNLNGTDGKRIVTALSADELKYINPAQRGGGSINCSYRRAK